MNNRKNNFLIAVKTFVAVVVIGFSIGKAQGVFITEIADPHNVATGGRFVELYNNTDADIDLTGWALRRWTNANTDPQADKALQGTIPAGGFFIITNSASDFEITYYIEANQDIGTGGPADGNGDDDLALINANGEVVDLYGEGGGTDNSGTSWEFEDGRAERIATVTAGNPTGDPAEWNIDNDSGGGDGPQEAPTDYDPGAWIGQPTPTNPYAHVWKLVPEAGALIVSSGENATGSIWWSNSAGDVTTRACLFDDKFVMHADGSFDNDMGTETWLEGWQGVDEGCGAPIAPHNNSNDATWSYNETDGTLKLSGVGAYFALAKAYNGGELSGTTDAVPDSRTYDILSFDGNLMTLSIEVGGNYWTFKFVRDGFDPFVDVTFSVDMNEVDTHPDGVYLAGGQFGQDGLLMDDSDGDDIWKVTVELAINQDVNYKFRNQPSFGTWDGFEDANALEPCGVGEYNDRIATIGDQDTELPLVCYGSCYSCDYVPPVSNVTFYLDMNDQTISDQGVYVAGASWGEPNDGNQSGRLTDHNGDGVYEGTFEITTGSSIFYTYTNGHGWGNKENIEGQPCANPGNYNDRSLTVTENTNVIAKFQDCNATYSDSVYVEFTVDMGDEVISDAGLFLAGGNYFGGPWEGRFPFTQVDGTTNTWYLADSFPAVLNDAYTYVNGTGWDNKENIQDQDCAFGQWSDREFRTTIVDRQVDHCFGLCGDGLCSDIEQPETVEVTFSTDANAHNDMLVSDGGTPLELIYATGSFEGWSGYGVPLTDEDGDGIYKGVAEMLAHTVFEYKFIVGGWGSFESGAEVGGSCDWNPDDEHANYGAYVGDNDIALPTYVFGGGCQISGEQGPEPGIVFSGPFGGAQVDGETYTNPTGSESWAGFANEDVSVYPFSFPYGGAVSFEASSAGGDVDVYFRFEYNPHPYVDPSYNTETVTVSGSEPMLYEVGIPPQGENTFSSFLLYVVTQDAPVTIKHVHVFEEDTEQYTFSNYSLEVSDVESYNAGTASTLPPVDVEGEGIVITATFDTNSPAPYVGALAVYWDANFNGILDDGDLNILDDQDDYDDYYYDDNSRDHENDSPSVVALVDNDYNDSNTEEGVYVLIVDDVEFMEVQGATFFFAALDAELVVTQTITAKPFSSSPIRFTGHASEMSEQAAPVYGVFVELGRDVGYYYDMDGDGIDDYYYYDTEDLTEGITGLDGIYDIGVSPDTIAVGDVVRVSPYHSEEENGGRLVPLVELVDDYTGNIVYGNEALVTITDETQYNTVIGVLKLNTLVQGFAYGFDGQPLSGYIWVDSQIGSDDNIIELFGFSEVDDNGYYSFWAQNGTELNVTGSFDGGPFVQESFFLQAETYDEGLGAFVYNYNIDVTPPQATGYVEGFVYSEQVDEYGNYYTMPLSGVEIMIYNEDDFFSVYTIEGGYYLAEVPAPAMYYVAAANNVEGYTNHDSYNEVFVHPDEYHFVQDIYFYPEANYFTVSGYVNDQDAMPVYDVSVDFESLDGNYYGYVWTDENGYYSIDLPEGIYNAVVYSSEHYNEWVYDVEVSSDVTLNFYLNLVGNFTGSVQGVISYVGEYQPDGPAFINVWNDTYDVYFNANEDGFYSTGLIDGVYNIYVDAPGYESYYRENAFEINGNTVTYDIELFEYGFAGPPQMVDLHDVPNDQGRQMRAVWNAGMPGSWNYYTQFSIWRKVNNAPIDLWDYVETVPWHGMDPYAAVLPTLGDSSAHGMHMSTFMITAHTEDVSVWLDSEPMSGYSIDNLHPGAPMSLAFSASPGSVSLTWSGPVDEDFSYFNIYRQDILSNEPAMVFTTTDSFYVDQELEDVGAYEYWVTAMDISGLESDASSIVSAVLSADEKMGMPTEFALKQNYPNPFNPSTQIQYALPSESRVVISIYDLTGRKIRTLVNEVQSAGHRSVMWNATNEIGRQVSAGMYIYSIQAGDFIQNRKMVLMK